MLRKKKKMANVFRLLVDLVNARLNQLSFSQRGDGAVRTVYKLRRVDTAHYRIVSRLVIVVDILFYFSYLT